VEGGVGVYGDCAGDDHVKVWIDGVVVDCDEGMRPWGRSWVR
jgi:hypothetical protein